ncbi:unnamed protein product, partial [Rotaria magnacalcarata]
MQVSSISTAPYRPRIVRVSPRQILSNNSIHNAGTHNSLPISPSSYEKLSFSFSNNSLNPRSSLAFNRGNQVSPEERHPWQNITKRSKPNRKEERQLSGRKAWCLLCSVLAVGLIVCAVIGTDVVPPHRRQSQRRQQRQQQQLLLHQRRQVQQRHPRQQQPQLHRQQQQVRQQQVQQQQQQQPKQHQQQQLPLQLRRPAPQLQQLQQLQLQQQV